VEKRHTQRKDGSERWESLTYHADFKSALVSLAEYQIRSIEDSASVAEIKARFKEIRDECVAASEVFRELGV
jgi:hypothetical protein